MTGRGGEGDVLPSSVPTDADVPSSDTSSSLASGGTQDPTHRLTQIAHDQAPTENVELTLDGFALDEITLVNSSMLPYLAMIATVIEKRAIDVKELLYLLRRSMRQRSFDRLPRREYVLGFLNQHPP